MLVKTIKFTDFNGVERIEDHYFNLSKTELLKLELTTYGGFTERVQKIVDSPDVPTLVGIFEDFILRSYGEKSADGKRLEKGANFELAKAFKETAAYDVFFMELISSSEAAAAFLNGIVPKEISEKLSSDPKYIEMMSRK